MCIRDSTSNYLQDTIYKPKIIAQKNRFHTQLVATRFFATVIEQHPKLLGNFKPEDANTYQWLFTPQNILITGTRLGKKKNRQVVSHFCYPKPPKGVNSSQGMLSITERHPSNSNMFKNPSIDVSRGMFQGLSQELGNEEGEELTYDFYLLL